MKKLMIMLSVLFAFGMLWACSSDDEMNFNGGNGVSWMPEVMPEDSLDSIPVLEYTGRLYYSNFVESWVISYVPAGPDWVAAEADIYFPLNLPDEFKANKEEYSTGWKYIPVNFSGKLIDITEDVKDKFENTPVTGRVYYYVYLNEIEKLDLPIIGLPYPIYYGE